MTTEPKTLNDAMPWEFQSGEFDDVPAQKFKDVEVYSTHRIGEQTGRWPGTHKNVNLWVKLKNGYAVGWNENDGRGWSFPIYKLK